MITMLAIVMTLVFLPLGLAEIAAAASRKRYSLPSDRRATDRPLCAYSVRLWSPRWAPGAVTDGSSDPAVAWVDGRSGQS